MAETLVIVDTPRIQSYIFSSNRLRENIGASHLVKLATGDWPLKCVHKDFTHHNVFKTNAGIYSFDGRRVFEDQEVQVEVLYIGGGSFVALFREEGLARKFTTALSRIVLIKAPGLQIRVIHHPVDFENRLLKDSFREAMKKHDTANSAYLRSAPLLGLGVTVTCDTTGLPAVGSIRLDKLYADEGDSAEEDANRVEYAIVSAQVYSKTNRDQIKATNESLRRDLALPNEYEYPHDFDHLGRSKGEHSYIAVIHADGNGIGELVRGWGQEVEDLGEQENQSVGQSNRDYIDGMRTFTNNLRHATLEAVKDVQFALLDWLDGRGGDQTSTLAQSALGEVRGKLDERGRHLIPFRPLIAGGDDVTFVCDGRLGIRLAVYYLERFKHHTQEMLDQELTASAGIAIVKSHYPFSRAYNLADDLCSSGKAYRRRENIEDSCIDWHFAMAGLSGDLSEIRRREYMPIEDNNLQLRPITFENNGIHPVRQWATVKNGINRFRDDEWQSRRNKVKQLYTALREGEDAVRHFRLVYDSNHPLPTILEPDESDLSQTGWIGLEELDNYGKLKTINRCGYFDALEMLDWYIDVVGETTDG